MPQHCSALQDDGASHACDPPDASGLPCCQWRSAGRRAWELCSWRGLASLPSRPMGELMRRRWDSVEAYVSRLSTCAAHRAPVLDTDRGGHPALWRPGREPAASVACCTAGAAARGCWVSDADQGAHVGRAQPGLQMEHLGDARAQAGRALEAPVAGGYAVLQPACDGAAADARLQAGSPLSGCSAMQAGGRACAGGPCA